MSEAFLPLSVPVVAGNEWTYIKECLDTAWVSSVGAYVERFEEAIRQLTGAHHAVAVVNGTAGLHMALVTAGVRPGDLVVVPSLTFIATANAVRHAGADPVFVDCDEYMNIAVTGVRSFLEEACVRGNDGVCRERASGRAVRAVLPVHVYGRPADMAALQTLADEHGLAVIEDASEALGSRWSGGPLAGRSVGTIGQSGVFSFNGNKIVTCGGGGMYVTADERAAERVRHLTTQAKTDTLRFIHDEVGWNYRLTNIAAALGLAQTEQLAGFIAAKRAQHQLYAELLTDVPGITLMGIETGTQPNYWFHTIMVEPGDFGANKEGLMAALRARRIETRPLWGLLHDQTPYHACTAWRVERARWFWDRALNLPCSSNLAPRDVERVATAIREAGRSVKWTSARAVF